MGTILRFLGDNGFRWAYRVLDAQWFGVAQRRRRVFIVGSRGTASPTEILFEPSCVSGDSPPRREAGEETAIPTVVSPLDTGEWRGPNRNQIGTIIAPTLIKGYGGHGFTGTTQDAISGAVVAATGEVRRLMPVECERLQGFPDGWSSDIVSDSQAYRQMGNAVCVNVAEWVGRRIVATS